LYAAGDAPTLALVFAGALRPPPQAASATIAAAMKMILKFIVASVL
jgi:hypothetical protein